MSGTFIVRLIVTKLLTALFLLSVGFALSAETQQEGKVYRIGLIVRTSSPNSAYDAFFDGLRELGYVEGKNIVVERRYAEGKAERYPELAVDLVRLKVDLIVVFTTPAALAARSATTTIPILIPTANDPVGTGLAKSLAHPGQGLATDTDVERNASESLDAGDH